MTVKITKGDVTYEADSVAEMAELIVNILIHPFEDTETAVHRTEILHGPDFSLRASWQAFCGMSDIPLTHDIPKWFIERYDSND